MTLDRRKKELKNIKLFELTDFRENMSDGRNNITGNK